MDNLTKKPHKHAALIKAWADGKEIEFFNEHVCKWQKTSNPLWASTNTQFRIKEASKPDTIHLVEIDLGLYAGPMLYAALLGEANCKLVFDGTTGKLKEATVI